MGDGERGSSIVMGFVLSSVFWLVVGLVVGLWVAAEMIFPALNLTPWLAFGQGSSSITPSGGPDQRGSVFDR